MQTDGSYLFVYGTLMSGAVGALGAAQRARLARESVSLGAATTAGAELFDLGRYPGLAECTDAGCIVHGEALQLANPARTFSWLDAYEGVAPSCGEASEYARLERMVRLEHGPETVAWVYVLRRGGPRHALIAGGRWKGAR